MWKAPAWYAVGCPSIRLGPDAMIHGFIILLSVLITAVANAGESGTASHYSTRDKDQNAPGRPAGLRCAITG